MKNDKVLKEKMSSLDTLSSGIVFGKEEAWDKLQARMDKPAKVIPLKFWMAAAAILLLFVTVFLAVNNNTPVNEVVKNNIPPQAIPANNTVTTPPEQYQTAVEKNTTVTTHKVIKHTPITEKKQSTQPKTEETQIVQTPVVETPVTDNTAMVSNMSTPIVTATKIPTKVVHINELGKSLQEATPAVATNYTSVKIQKLHVVHLNDFNQQQNILNEYRYQQKDNIAVSVPLFNPAYRYDPKLYSKEIHTPHNPLRFKLN